MPPRLRRVVFLVLAGAALGRVVVLGQERGWGLVGPAVVRVTATALAAWLAHLVLHELAHWVAATTQGFWVRAVRFAFVTLDLEGPRPRLRWGGDLGGGVSSLPRGAAGLPGRLRRVALAGPLASASATLGLAFAWARAGDPSLASPLGIFFVMGAFAVVTALLPSALLPEPPGSGSDLEQVLQPRRVLAHWTNAAALEAVLRGAPLDGPLHWQATAALLPEGGPAEPFELGWCFACLEAGEVDRARARLESVVQRLGPDAPDWFVTDVFTQRGLLAALHGGDAALARACLEPVAAHQSLDWYVELLRAAVAAAEGDPVAARAHLARWTAEVDRHPRRLGLLAGNRWALAHLGGSPGIDPAPDGAVR